MNKIKLLEKLSSIIENSSYRKDESFVRKVIKDLDIRYYLIDKLIEKKLPIAELNFLWEELIRDARPFQLFKILKNNIRKDTYKYIISFLSKNYKNLDSKFRDDLFQKEAIDIIQVILEKYSEAVDLAYEFVKQVFKARKNSYKNLDSKRDLERERKAISSLLSKIFNIYLQQDNQDNIQEIISLIDKHFNLVSDDGKYTHYTPNEIFKLLGSYIEQDFESNFLEIVNLLVSQYKRKDWYGRDWEGWDLIVSGISQSGSEYFIGDKHFITMALSPALMNYYKQNPSKAWQFILDNCVTQTKEEVKPEKADFLNRVALPILLREYKKGSNSKQAFEILNSYICMGRGIPHKTKLIFLAIYENNPKLSDKKKWDLIKTQLDCPLYKGLPDNPFVERIASDLAQKGNKDAAKEVASWPKNEEYRKRQRFDGFMVSENTWKLLDNKETFDEGLSSFKEYISSEQFQKELDNFEAWDVAKGLTKILEKKTKVGIEILEKIWSKDKLTDNQQIVVCDSINSLSEEKEKLLIQVFKDFLQPKLKELSNKQIENKISFNHARESLIKFAEKLAKKRNFPEALWLVEKLIADSDPSIKDKSGRDDGLNYHQQIINNENPSTISTIRGWCAWVLQKFTVIGGQDYIERVIKLTEQLSKDDNYYVRLQACIPLTALARTRHSVLPDSKERFMSLKQAQKVEEIAFSMVDDPQNQKHYAVMKSLARVFTYMRSLLSDEAIHVLETFKNLKLSTNDKTKDLLVGVIEEISPLYVYYAEFRKEAFKEKRYKELYGEKLWQKLNDFDSKPFKQILKDLLLNGKDSVRANFAWNFWKLPQEKEMDFDRGFSISMHYINILVKKYSHGVFEDVYHFIEDNFEEKPKECLALWKKCIKKERPYFKKHFNDETWHEMHWWPFFYNGKILKLVAERESNEEFLKWLEYLADYPKKALVANDLNLAVDHLKTFPKGNDDVERVFNKLIDRNAKYFDDMQEWKKKN